MFKNNFIRDYNRLTERWIKEYAEEREGENVVFSPFSLISLLSIAADATEGRTREEIETNLCGNTSFSLDSRDILVRYHGNPGFKNASGVPAAPGPEGPFH